MATKACKIYALSVLLSACLLLLDREIFLPAKKLVLWQEKRWAQNYGESGPEVMQHN